MSAALDVSASLPGADDLASELKKQGHVFLSGNQMRPLLEAVHVLSDWPAFVASWDHMPVDTYMADGGRYRRRRYAVFAAQSGALQRQAHQAHFQSLDYNTLNGGLERWFEPIDTAIAQGATMSAVLQFCQQLFSGLAAPDLQWHVEVHQFRIEASAGEAAHPTPEGVHRDGVDYVLVLLVRRQNIASGTTTIHAPDGDALGSFTLTQAFDAVLVDDHRVYHGVTPVQPLDASAPAYRDVLVVTFRKR